jgi:hypothetical protein
MKLYERLGIEKFVDRQHLAMLSSVQQESPKTGFEIAWNRFSRADLQGLVALDCYFMDEWENARRHAQACLKESDEFLFGTWRSEVNTPDGVINPLWWKKYFRWVGVFEHCLLWGAVLDDWDFLKRASLYPDETAFSKSGATLQDSDLLICVALLLRGESRDKCQSYLDRMSVSPNLRAKILSQALSAILEADANRLADNLAAYLRRYKAEEFPKENIMKKVSVEGTLLMHWAIHCGIQLDVPSGFEDCIVPFKLQRL